MNGAQRTIMALGLVAMVGLTIFAPYSIETAGPYAAEATWRSPLWSPPDQFDVIYATGHNYTAAHVELNAGRLLVELALLVGVTVMLTVIATSARRRAEPTAPDTPRP